MKNVILGIVGSMIVLYTVILSLGIYSVSVREDELDSCVAEVMMTTMKRYYVAEELAGVGGDMDTVDEGRVREELEKCLRERLHSASEVNITIRECNMTLGILSVSVEEIFMIPNGKKKKILCEKTLIDDRQITEESVD